MIKKLDFSTSREDFYNTTVKLGGYAVSFNSLVKGTGAISGGAVNADNGVRPVINIKGDVSFTGTGTSLDPYVINF